MQERVGDKICEFEMGADGMAMVKITFPRAKIFKPQPDGSVKVFEGQRVVKHSQDSLQSIIEQLKNPKDLTNIQKLLEVFVAKQQ